MESNNQWDIFFGIAAEDKVHNSRILKVYTKELSPFTIEELSDKTTSESFTVENEESDSTDTSSIMTTNVLTAEWFGLDTNRVFPPDIRKGEQVFVFRYRDTDLFYWISSGRNDDLRRLECHRIAVSNDDAHQKTLDDDNTYFIELDTLFRKRLRLVTSKSDGEEFRYEITIDAKHSTVTIRDDDGNEITMESRIPRIYMRNKSGCIVDLHDKDVIIGATRDMYLTAGRQIIETSPCITREATSTIVDKSPNAGEHHDHKHLNCSTFGISGATNINNTLHTNATFTSIVPGSGSGTPTVDINNDNGSKL